MKGEKREEEGDGKQEEEGEGRERRSDETGEKGDQMRREEKLTR